MVGPELPAGRTAIPGTASGAERLIAVMARLRDPDHGCPWDREQTFATIAPYTIEEAYEVADAIAREAWDDLEGELGDLLLQVAYHARLAEERGLFTFETVANAIADKMIRRHPHVFGEGAVQSSAAQRVAWEETKAKERRLSGHTSVLDDVPVALPALTRAAKLQRRAARTGFDWNSTAEVFGKIHEELAEVEAEIVAGSTTDALKDEVGDLLFAVVNLARRLELDPEEALRAGNRQFERRFRAVEHHLALATRDGGRATLEELDAAWDAVKATERDRG